MEPEDSTFIEKFTVLKTAVRELWIIYAIKVFEILSYGLVTSTLVLWLSSDLGYNDATAGYMIATWSTVLTFFTVLVGSLVDAVGLRKAFLLGFWICLFSRLVLAASTSRWIVIPLGLMVLAAGESLMVPVMIAAVKRFSTTAQRSMAFSIFYALMNVAFAIGGWLFDYLRRTMGEYGHAAVPLLGTLSTYRVILLYSVAFTIPGLLLIYLFLREGVEVTDEGVHIRPEKPKYKGHGLWSSICLMVRDTLRETVRIFSGLWKQPNFYRFLVFLGLCVAVRLIYYHMYYTFPKYGIRELGEGAPIGRLFGVLNPVLIVLLVPLVGALTQKISAYRMISIGSLISALSVFFIALPPEWFRPLADGWLGHLIARTWLGVQGDINPLYVSITLFVSLLSVGEALWSPRLYEYTAAIAPKGQEASYMSMSLLPYFVAKFFVGMFSGHLLMKYCPASGPRDSATMWFWIGVMSMATPIGLFVLRRYIQVQEAGREPGIPRSEEAVEEKEILQEEE
jgi:MFS family permease